MRNAGVGGGPGPVVPEPDAPRFGRRELRVLAPDLRPYRRRALWAAVLLIVSQAALLSTPLLVRYGIDAGIAERDLRAVNLAAAGLLVASIAGAAAMRRSIRVSGEVGEQALRSIRVRVFDHLTRLDLGFFEREKAGRLVARLTSDVETIEILVTESLVQMLATSLYIVGAVTVLFTVDVQLALASVGLLLPLMTLALLGFRKRSTRAYNLVRDRIAAVLSYMQETVRGVHVVQAFGRERVNASRFAEVNDEWREANVQSFRLGSTFFPLMELIGLAGTMLVLGFGGWRTLQGDLSLGSLAAFALYLSSTLEPVQTLSQLYDTFQAAMSGLAKLANVLEQRPRVVDADDAAEPGSVGGALSVDRVTFRYRDELAPALSGIDLRIRPGQVVALVGPTGAGKSTIAKLVLRFYDPSEGSVALDDTDLRRLRLETLRRHTSVVPQEGFLFSGTIADNIRFGRPGASQEDIEGVCRLLEIDGMIRALPAGYDTQVRERGAALSGGQRQLLAIARALIADPRVLVLDEATSALDASTETHVESALRLATAGRTTIVIAHRLSTAARADLIVVVDAGRIVESGRHDELASRPGGTYARLYEHWLASR